MLNKKQKEVLADKLRRTIYHFGVARGEYYVDFYKDDGTKKRKVDEAYNEIEQLYRVIRALLEVEIGKEPSAQEVYKWIGMDYFKDYADYVVVVEQQTYDELKGHLTSEEEDIPF